MNFVFTTETVLKLAVVRRCLDGEHLYQDYHLLLLPKILLPIKQIDNMARGLEPSNGAPAESNALTLSTVATVLLRRKAHAGGDAIALALPQVLGVVVRSPGLVASTATMAMTNPLVIIALCGVHVKIAVRAHHFARKHRRIAIDIDRFDRRNAIHMEDRAKAFAGRGGGLEDHAHPFRMCFELRNNKGNVHWRQ